MLQLLESIGVISTSNRKKAESRFTTYQDTVTAPLARELDGDDDGDDGADYEDLEEDIGDQKLEAVTKVRIV